MFEITILLITSIMMFVTFAPFSPSNHWISRVWEFPRVQIAVITLVLMFASSFIDSPVLCLVLLITNALLTSYQLMWIFPYTRLCTKQVPKSSGIQGQPSIKIMTSNVLMPNRQVNKLIDLVNHHQPDVLVTLETDLWWETQLASIHKDYPYRVNHPLDNLYGMHLYSKYALEDIQVLELIEKDIPSIHCYLILNEDTKIKCHFLHPAPPSPTENDTSTPRDKELLVIAKQIAKKTEATIVTGDLNDVAWSPTTKAFRQISGLKDPRIGRGMFNTFHADYPFLRWPLDHIFHSEHFTLSKIERMPSVSSDHFPLLSELIYDPK
ncbi:endonuclease/exonuclease/phosphatase family protein [Psychromonas sp. 14N.309.X.WAT.B.A12]|uniref:endonuclease/exonuclease/phosphatase family protein n=1 Tax=Psychromonas sp. 14N.309.X.WAT.B.A12 TaxID=2998322 RepID=UPI0025B0C219|nr:endonuclease/exonuclease/phosphatase family protein [Psychromonas sp. 14N.309.X.WAT.B.A12]MDN2664140.1 endonuclease/exonuclease/phosphatase family protein [Psychromonas sp. 14N.309.X.WAT.B.A12]